MKESSQYERSMWTALFAGMAMLFTIPAQADYKGALIPFPQASIVRNDQDIASLDKRSTYAAVNFFYTAEDRQVRLLAEYFVDHKQQEMERLAVGWVSQAGTQVWFGRFHTALDQWNRKYHHGAYLQTTLHRPGLIEFEDNGGVIPAHATGVTIDRYREDNAHVIDYTLDVGLGPELTPGHLLALDILTPAVGQHKLSVVTAISRHSIDSDFDDQGLFAGYIDIPSSVSGINEVAQKILGGYLNASMGDWHLTTSVTWVDLRLDLTAADVESENFSYGYLQPEYWLDADWTLYSRVEGIRNGQRSLYLQQIPGFVRHRGLVGARYQLSDNQALKFELATIDQFGQRFHQAAMQWSAALP